MEDRLPSRPTRRGKMERDGVSWLELTETQHRSVVHVLQKVRAEHGARFTFLVDASGRPLAVSHPDAALDVDGLASLCASAVAAAARLAEMLGEPGAGLVLQRGDRDVLFLEASENLIVSVVLDSIHPTGLERVRAKLRLKRALTELRKIISLPPAPAAQPGLEDSEIEALLKPIGAGGSRPRRELP